MSDPRIKLDKVPLDLKSCPGCSLIQLGHSVDKATLYSQYWYKSSINSSMALALGDVVRGVGSHVHLQNGESVLDIGCNDGALLEKYQNNVTTIGIDPCQNILPTCDIFYNGFFPDDLPDMSVKAVTAIAMFYDVDDPKGFLDRVKSILSYNGIFVVQMTDLMSMLAANAFDNICHEHVVYYSLANLGLLAQNCGLDIFHVETNLVNGGSLRAYMCHAGQKDIKQSVMDRLDEEGEAISAETLIKFRQNIDQISSEVFEIVSERVHAGDTVDVLGASTKGNTFLQVSGIGNSLIRQAAEVNEGKFGLYTGGSNIPIVSQEVSLSNPPDYYLVLPWHFIDTFIASMDGYLKSGGKFIVPMPEPKIVCKMK